MAEIKVNEEELNLVQNTMKKDSEDIDSAIETITHELESLREIWEGQDADKFFNNAREFFEKMKGVPICMRNMGTFVEKANGSLIQGDEEFSKELETEVDEEYEQSYY